MTMRLCLERPFAFSNALVLESFAPTGLTQIGGLLAPQGRALKHYGKKITILFQLVN